MELNFQMIVLIIASFLLILSLITIGYTLRSSQKSKPWPPEISKCPDYWNVDNDGKICKPNDSKINVGKLGESASLDISMPDYVGSQGKCNLSNWAIENQVVWDGITLDGEKLPGCK